MLVLVDTSADTFGGNENARIEVRQYVQRTLTHIAKKLDCAVVLSSHPSKSGESSGAGDGGSTAWSNSVRSRTYLEKDEQTGKIIFSNKKNNRGPLAEDIELFWHDGAIVPYIDCSGIMGSAESAVENAALKLLGLCNERGLNVGLSKYGSYAPKQFVKMNKAHKLKHSLGDYETAIERLLDQGKVAVTTDRTTNGKHLVVVKQEEKA